jgi:3-hydroxyacyl-CoA dehydrogenase
MGAAIAAHCANAGLQVDLLDIAPKDGEDKNAVVNGGYERMVKARPPALMAKDVAKRIHTGNFDDDLERVAEADWVLEAILERLEPKRELAERVEALAKDDAIISSNTSGIPLHQIAEGRSESFRRRFPRDALLQPAALPEAAGDHPDRGDRRGDRREGP